MSRERGSDIDRILFDAGLTFDMHGLYALSTKIGVDYWDFVIDYRQKRSTNKDVLEWKITEYADGIFNEFSHIKEAFRTAFILPFRSEPQPELLFPRLHEINR